MSNLLAYRDCVICSFMFSTILFLNRVFHVSRERSILLFFLFGKKNDAIKNFDGRFVRIVFRDMWLPPIICQAYV